MNQIKIGYRATGQRGHLISNLERGLVFGANHPHPTDFHFHDLKVNHAAADLLLGQLHIYRLIAGVLVHRLQGPLRLSYVVQRFIRPQIGINRALDIACLQHGITTHDVLINGHRCRDRRPGGIRFSTLLRPCQRTD